MSKNLPTNDAAEFIGISPRTLERWRITNQGPSFLKLGKRVLYPEQLLEHWKNAHTVNPEVRADSK